MNPKDLFLTVAKQSSKIILQVENYQLESSTPCIEWNLGKLINHMVYELLWMPELIAGKTVVEVGNKYEGDVLKGDFEESWEKALEIAVNAVAKADINATAHLSYADVHLGAYISEVAGDILIHSWDVCQSSGQQFDFDEQLVDEIYNISKPRIDEFMASGLFGKPFEVAKTSSNLTKLLALTGRTNN